MSRVTIPIEEYKQRVQNAAAKVRERGLDVLVVNGSESDYANTRYFSNFWPVFERCGVAISADGRCAIMVGPESDLFAADFGVIEDVFVLREYRESANPAYPARHTKKFKWAILFSLTFRLKSAAIRPASACPSAWASWSAASATSSSSASKPTAGPTTS